MILRSRKIKISNKGMIITLFSKYFLKIMEIPNTKGIKKN